MTVRETAGKDREQEGVLTVLLHTHQLASKLLARVLFFLAF